MQATLSLRQRATVWSKSVDGPVTFARRAGWLLGALAIALLARYGTPVARTAAIAGFVGGLLLLVVLWVLRSRRTPDARRLVRQVIIPTDAALGERALRAAGLVERLASDADSSASTQLARFHLDRIIEGASLSQVESAASRRALRYRILGAGAALVALAVGLVAAREVAEGFDVLLARGPRAPLPMFWTERLRVVAQPPAYLRVPGRRIAPGAASMLPEGTHLTLRARPLFEGRQLVVSDGEREFPFVSDGEGGVVAHYSVENNATLVVAARFGEVLIVEPEALRIVALSDQKPEVILEQAPATLALTELERLELRWRALDDHGISQVDLVLRSGTREERRLLASYEDEGPVQQGGHVLLASDPFLRSLYLPARVSVEARDNDPNGDAIWGQSEAFTIVPTAVGEPDAARYLALVQARDQFVDALASADAARATPARGDEARYARRLERAVRGLEDALSGTYAGLTVPPGLRSFALGRLQLLISQVGPSRLQEPQLSELILALDGALSSLSRRDAQRVSKLLAEVAEEAMVGAHQARGSEGPELGLERLDRALFALRAGAEQLLALGSLGNDLGSVALADLGRVQRGRDGGDLYHAELAARHLADRLRRPTPSFGASGSGGVEAGQPQAATSEPSEHPSGAEQQFDELANQIADLAREHAAAVEHVDQTLSEARSRVDDEALRAEAERRASELRDHVEGLPEPGHSPGTAEASAALGREHARAMAHNLESLRLADAVESGRRALGSLAEAASRSSERSRLHVEAEMARAAVQEQLAWAESQSKAARNAARDKSRDALQGPASLEEELASTAARLAQRGQTEATPLPAEVTERLRQADQLMRQAARALENGEGETGLTFQRRAQRLLESADRGKTSDPAPSEPTPSTESDAAQRRTPGFRGDVPEASEQNRAEEFRRRVLRSLGDNPTGPLAPAIKRYAEGLLR